ncbi:tandem-95 repeat protein [Zavarzinella formosa]|uniref:tandem-95 repeat protein n=1 Tax=Zavarzinella formosa TaxID=360055 RepID=UPI0002FED69B|nr:Ig-like domain-containing protein [Zavarzinella formosa]
MPKHIRPRLEELHARITPVAGALDPSFNGDGLLYQNGAPGSPQTSAHKILVQPDRKIVVAGSAGSLNTGAGSPAVFRYNRDGTPDTTFGNDGVATINVPAGFGLLYSAALQPDGKIVATGTAMLSGNYEVVVIRLNSNGTPDGTFGGGDGIVLTDLSPADDNGFAIAVQPDGKILVGGSSQVSPTQFTGQMLALRYDANGTLDPTFDHDGIVKLTFGVTNPTAEAVMVQTNGKIVLAGLSSTSSGNFGFALARLNTDGSLDTAFGNSGQVLTSPDNMQFEAIHDAVLLPDGKILAVGGGGIGQSIKPTPVLLRYTTSGALDHTFGTNGIATMDLPFGGGGDLSGVALQSNGRILVAGLAAIEGGSKSLLARYTANGKLDPSFGPPGHIAMPGVVLTDLVPNDNDGYASVAVQSDDKILTAGGGSSNLVVARYQPAAFVPPEAEDDSYTTDEDKVLIVDNPGVLANDTTSDGLTTRIYISRLPAHGTLRLSQKGGFNYTPNPNFNGTDSFDYYLSDRLRGEPATVTLTVNPVNDAPTAVTDDYVIPTNGDLVVPADSGVLANDTDLEGDSLTAVLVTPPPSGTLHLSPDGSFTFTPAVGFVGRISFQYKANDGNADSPVQTVTMTRGPLALIDGTRLIVIGTDGADSVRLQPVGATSIYVEILTPDGLFRQTLHPPKAGQPFTLIDVNLGGGNDWFDGSTVSRPMRLIGGTGNDVLTGGCGADTIYGDNPVGVSEGDDVISAGAGNDRVFVGDGTNRVDAGAGNDTVTAGNGINAIYAGAGNDSVTGGAGRTFVDGGAGNDFISVLGGTNHLLGGDGNDVILGGSGADSIKGGNGNDLLAGGLGADLIEGDAGNDILFDGAVAVFNPTTDTLANVLANYNPASPSTYVQLSRRLVVTPDTATIDTLTGGVGRDWFWTSDGVDITDLLATEKLNG